MAKDTRICLIGPESTGKTELAAELSRRLGLPWVPEFAREYAERHPRVLTAEDVEPIARGQRLGEDAVPPPVILDTDLLSTVVYARYYYGSCPAWIESEATRRRADLYLLCDTDVAWASDLIRTAGADDEREEQFDAFLRAMDEFKVRWAIVSGHGEERVRAALDALRSHSLTASQSHRDD